MWQCSVLWVDAGTTGSKTQHIVPLAEATAIHDKVVRQKIAKGYHLTDNQNQKLGAIAHARDAGEDKRYTGYSTRTWHSPARHMTTETREAW
jgi:hypothetical protein